MKANLDEVIIQHPRLKFFLKAMQRCSGFGLYFVSCNTTLLRNELLVTIKEASAKPIVELDIDPENDIYVDAQVSELMKNEPDNALVFIYGLEKLFYLEERPLMEELNWRRGFYGRIEHPIVFWLPDFLITEIFNYAPDFADWYSGVYEFSLSASEKNTLALQTWDSANEKIIGSLSLEEKQRWIINLKNLLAELDSENTKTQSDLINRLGLLYDSIGKYEKALDCYQQALNLFQQLDDKKGEGEALNNISQIYDAQGDYDTALRFLQDSLAICQQIGDTSGLCATLFNIGHIHKQKGNNEQALTTWREVYQMAKKIGLAQVLNALETLAKELGGEDLEFWESKGDGKI